MNCFTYKGAFIVVNSNNSVDVVDKASGKWYVAKSIRSAKWNLSVWRRLNREFQ